MRKVERALWIAAVVVLLVLVAGLRSAWRRDRAQWQSTLAAATAAPVVLVKYSGDDGRTIELWRGLPGGERSRLVSELEPRDGVVYADLRDALDGRE